MNIDYSRGSKMTALREALLYVISLYYHPRVISSMFPDDAPAASWKPAEAVV